MDVLLQHLPDLARVTAVIEALVLADGLSGEAQERGCPFYFGGEVEDRRVRGQVGIDLNKGPREPLELKPVVLLALRHQSGGGICGSLLVYCVARDERLKRAVIMFAMCEKRTLADEASNKVCHWCADETPSEPGEDAITRSVLEHQHNDMVDLRHGCFSVDLAGQRQL